MHVLIVDVHQNCLHDMYKYLHSVRVSKRCRVQSLLDWLTLIGSSDVGTQHIRYVLELCEREWERRGVRRNVKNTYS